MKNFQWTSIVFFTDFFINQNPSQPLIKHKIWLHGVQGKHEEKFLNLRSRLSKHPIAIKMDTNMFLNTLSKQVLDFHKSLNNFY